MMNNGIIKELVSSPSFDGSNSSGATGTSAGSSLSSFNADSKKGKSVGGQGLLLKFPFFACLVTAMAVLLLVRSANRQGFKRDFGATSKKIVDAFFYESHQKAYAVHDASVTASMIAMQKPTKWKRKNPGELTRKGEMAPNDEALSIFQDRTNDMQLLGQIDAMMWYPAAAETHHVSMTCETERACKGSGGKVRGQAIEIVQESKAPVTSEAFRRSEEPPENVRTAIFYPIRPVHLKDILVQEDIIGVIAADFRWTEFFSPATFDEETEGLVIVVENTCGQAFSYRVHGQELTYVGKGYIHDNEYSDMTVFSDYIDFVKPGLTKTGACGCDYRIRIYPSKDMFAQYSSSWPRLIIMGTSLAMLTLLLSFLAYDIYVSREFSHLSDDMVRFNTIVGSLFPEVVLDRVVQEDLGRMEKSKKIGYKPIETDGAAVTYDEDDFVHSNRFLADYKLPVDKFGSVTEKPIYNSFPHTTISFLDVAGFTSWSSERDPEQVFMLLESVYQKFDSIGRRLKVFKIETIGDCYVAVTGVPEPQKNHCLLMCRFAYEAMLSFVHLCKSLEVSLGPGTADLGLRVGIHSGSVIAGVLRAEKVRFQLFGDTMNTASRMESTGEPGKVQISKESAVLLQASGKGNWLEPRADPVSVKGKGHMKTYWLKISSTTTKLTKSTIESGLWGEDVNVEDSTSPEENLVTKRERLIEWNTEVLLDLLRKVVSRRRAIERRNRRIKMPATKSIQDSNRHEYQRFLASRNLVEHASEVIPFASYEEDLVIEDPSEIRLGPEVEAQARAYVAEVSSLYNPVPFHNFEHASHVVMSAKKLLGRVVSPQQGGFKQVEGLSCRETCDKSFGISVDPLMHFALAQSAMIHDVAHYGVSNKQLVKNNKEMAARYNSQSVAEQHSLLLSMHAFSDDKYDALREALLSDDPEETKRYYQFLVASVLATDIADPKLKAARQARWDEAFQNEDAAMDKERLQIDSFYLGELNRVDLHFRLLALLSAVVWAGLVYISYWATPEEHIESLVGIEQKAAGTAFGILVCGFLYKVSPQFLKLFEYDGEPLSGVVIGVITIEVIAMITDGLMAFGFPTPVMIDPILGTRVHLLRWCEWTPLAFYIYFITDGVDVPDPAVGLKSRYFFAGCQGLSTFAGFLFAFAPNGIVWGVLLFFSCVLFLFLYVHLAYKRKVHARLRRGDSLDDREIYDRSYHSLRFLEDVGVTWGILVFMYFLEGFGPMITPLFDFTRAEGFGMIWTSVFDCISKMHYMNHIMSINELVFDTQAREKRQKEESVRLKDESNKKATVLFEYIIQASDVAHCMQHWNIYQKWNRCLFEEMLKAYLKGDSDEDPRPGWYDGELWFFDNYIIPLASKLTDSGCFGYSGCEYLRCATENRNEWKVKGKEVTARMIDEIETELAGYGKNVKKGKKELVSMDRSGDTHSMSDMSDSAGDDNGKGGGGTPLSAFFCAPSRKRSGSGRKLLM
ncbi:Receptor-type guanylate cyclase gcy [Seminavis robusta]|uniref:Receptor-type guanylate cyclase gcy n=1 Tax=Seminavis robusta TaxID=568900 RepID=A0A9N8EQB9_9STRA|nr:Receptor-type guanylate cyclase gcy [Seminavis robusta]|eukprot:Sro1503_g278010.1 Receptor-type guanylate cyclase gcy (1469) ;mRNA; f:2615-8646